MAFMVSMAFVFLSKPDRSVSWTTRPPAARRARYGGWRRAGKLRARPRFCVAAPSKKVAVGPILSPRGPEGKLLSALFSLLSALCPSAGDPLEVSACISSCFPSSDQVKECLRTSTSARYPICPQRSGSVCVVAVWKVHQPKVHQPPSHPPSQPPLVFEHFNVLFEAE